MGSAYCSACKKAPRPKLKFSDSTDKRYHTKPWERLSRLVRDLNPICQFLINGKQCREPARIVHHIRSPRVAPGEFFNVANLVAVCREHHPPSEGDQPGDPRYYVPTRGSMGAIYEHPKQPKKGEVILTADYAIVG